MAIHYDHRQGATWVRILAVVLLLFFVGLARFVWNSSVDRVPPMIILAVGGGVAMVAVLVFASMRIIVDHEAVSWSFGPGFPNFRLPLADVRSAQVVQNSWLWGWGIRWSPAGWIYRVTGTHSVEIDTDKKKVFLGSDEPERLAEAILSAKG